MKDRWVSGTFDDYGRADEVLQALMEKIDARDISIFARDTGALREVITPSDRSRFDSVILTFGLAGALIGLLGGFLSAPTYGGTVIVTQALATFMGAAAGWVLGLVFGAVVHFDIPTYNAITEADLKHGNVMIVVHVRNYEQRYLAESIMDRFNVGDVVTHSESFVAT